MNPRLFLSTLGLSLALGAAGATPSRAIPSPSPEASPPRGRVVLPADVAPDRYRIEIVPDALAMTFSGTVDIDLDIRRATDRIVLNSADLVIDSAALDGEAKAPRVSMDAARQTAAFAFGRRLATGPRTLHLAYHGRINENAAGLFVLPYATAQGHERPLFTQFENSDARRFVPCWDEPGRKATFELGVVVPVGRMAVSNMPVATSDELADGRRHVRFAPTPKMSTYLLFFGSGDFERAHRLVDGVDVGVVVKRGDLASAAFALDAASRLLPWYNAYFGTPFPLPKLDLVAGAGASQFFGAMENWGAIFFFERALLIDPRVATQQDRQDAFDVIAHEMAHQWFGDLVTMAWWDDLWLNEGFASWMATKATDHFHPEWDVWLRAQRDGQVAMATDARDGTHPVITPIADVLQAAGAFDAITYSKGRMVIRALESDLGEQAFRDGVQRYMRRHAYGNTVTDDLWREMDRGSTHPVAGIAQDLTRQAGVPMIRARAARCEDGRTTVTLVQDRFAIDRSSSRSRTWRVPVALATPGGPVTRTLVSGRAPRDVTIPGCGPVLVNVGQTGYFRVAYDEAGLAAIAARYGELAPADQLGVLNDARSLAFNGDLPMARVLELMRALPADANPVVLSSAIDRLREIDALAEGLPMQPAWRKFGRAQLAPVMARVGWDGGAGESANEEMLRANVLESLAEFDDPAVLAEAGRRFDAFVAAPDSLAADARHTVLQIVGAHADAATWGRLHELARTARTAIERDEGYQLLAEARDPALAARALALSMSGEPAATSAPLMIATVAARHPRAAIDFSVAHWPAIAALVEPDSQSQFVPQLVDNTWDTSVLRPLAAFASAHIPANAQQDLRKSRANIRDLSRIRQARLPEVARWLAANGL